MKDKTVQELLHIMSQSLFDADLINAEAELLRRFEALEKKIESWRGSRDGVLQHIDEMAYEIESLKCCGNCGTKPSVSNMCRYMEWKASTKNVCDKWQSDGLTRAERESK